MGILYGTAATPSRFEALYVKNQNIFSDETPFWNLHDVIYAKYLCIFKIFLGTTSHVWGLKLYSLKYGGEILPNIGNTQVNFENIEPIRQ